MVKRFIAAAMLASALAAVPTNSQAAQGYMWCQAQANDGVSTTFYYSAVFPADSASAQDHAAQFKSEAEDAHMSAAGFQSNCRFAPSAQAAEEARDAAMQRAPGPVLAWPE